MHIYILQIDPPTTEHRCLAYCYTILGTSNGRSIYIYIYIQQCTYTYVRLTPLKSSRHLYKTITPNKSHI